MQTVVRRRRFGIAPPVWAIAGVVMTVLVGGLVLALGAGPTAPADDPGPGGVIGSIDPADAELGARSTTAGGPATGDPAAAASSAVPSRSAPGGGGGTSTGTANPPLGSPTLLLEVITSPNILTGWLVVVTITNPAAVAQTWSNVSVQAAGTLPPGAVESHTPGTRAYGSGTLACVEPTGPTAIAPGGSLSIDLSVNVDVDISQPKAQLNNSSCLAPQAG